MSDTSPTINLLKNKGVNYADRFINWALSAGRMIVVVTEIIALSAFIYRFSLDRSIIDLHGKIKQEQNIVEYYRKEEQSYRNVQDRIALANQVNSNQTTNYNVVQDLLLLIPQDVILTSFSSDTSKVRMSVTLQSPGTLKNFVQKLSTYKGTDSVSIDTIQNKPASAIIGVDLTILLKK
jgi:hypothetical protein